MNLRIKRIYGDAEYTVGRLYADGTYVCDTLENCLRDFGVKVPGKTAVPAGKYKVVLNRSPRFKRVLPLLIDVPNFEGVRIHTGNSVRDTQGCLLVGYNRVKGKVLDSRAAFKRLYGLLQAAEERGEAMTVEIE